MVLQSNGPMSFSHIQTEFGGQNPISLSEYYSGGANVPSSVTDIPTSTTTKISLSKFFGKAKVVAQIGTGAVQWITKLESGPSSVDQVTGITTTSDGGVVAAGYYTTTTYLSARNADGTWYSTALSASSTGQDPFLVKYNSLGAVQWIANLQSSSSGDDRFLAITSTSDGGVVAAGYYVAGATLTAKNADGTSFSTVLPASSTGIDPFLVKYNSTGTVQWIAKLQSSSIDEDRINAITSTSDGCVVAAGFYTSTGTLTAKNANGTSFNTTLPASNTGQDPFLVKYDSAGTVQWIAKLQSSGIDTLTAITSTSDGGVVAAGYYNSTNTLTANNADGTSFGTILPTSSTGEDPFIVKYNSTGTAQWLAKLQSSSAVTDRIHSITTTSDGGIIAAGYYTSTSTLLAMNADGTSSNKTLPASSTGEDSFLVKYSSSGTVQWIAKLQSSNTGRDQIMAVTSTLDGSVVAVGYYNSSGTLTAKNADGTSFSTVLPASNTGDDPFIVKYNSAGTVQWIAKQQCSDTLDRALCITSASDGGVIAAGYYTSTGILTAINADGTSFSKTLPASGTGQDPFLVKYL